LKQSLKNYKRIVVKFGGSLLYEKDAIDFALIQSIVAQIATLVQQKKEIILVSSGAIALGASLLSLDRRPKELSQLQAVAAIGQNELMTVYRRYCNEKSLRCGQVLLTWEDFSDRRRYLNAKNTLMSLLNFGAVPIVNENDTVATDEIKFGDNDRLSALVATLVSADLLIILSDIDGLLGQDKKTVLRVVDEITPQIRELACPSTRKTCTGGMVTKLEAAKIAINSGIPCVITNGRSEDGIIATVASPGQRGTLFVPKGSTLAAKKRWLAFGTKAKGKIIVDDGARQALLNKKSLLSVGVVATHGDFQAGDVVSVLDKQHTEFARGKVTLSAKQLEKVKGARHEKEIIHCDNLSILL
jgi:glutamate 5-kinase